MLIDFKTQAKIARIINSCTTYDQLDCIKSWLSNIRSEFKGDLSRMILRGLIIKRHSELGHKGYYSSEGVVWENNNEKK